MERAAVVVTGASTGIGAATTQLLAEQGFTVFAGVRTDADARRIASMSRNIRALMLDITDGAAIARAKETVAAEGVPLRGLVNNAGIALGGPLEYLPIEQLRRQFDVNVFGTMATTQAFLPLLHAVPGRIVMVGSISGRLPIPYIGPYSASKFALRALCDALRVELAPANITVSLVEPSSVKTPIWGKGRASRAKLLDMIPPGAMPYYRNALEAMMKSTESEEHIGMDAGVVAKVIFDALTASRPRANYLIGGPARAGSLVALLPARVRDSVIRKSMRLP
ncbi:MAG: SDR family oxidoreductase [Candidatus Eremiobacteraeota bacterium]|nr:SDR family oxidoreductase [Candidatus Eremiobacteraeota bacterium]